MVNRWWWVTVAVLGLPVGLAAFMFWHEPWAKVVAACGLWCDVNGALLLGSGLLNSPTRVRTLYRGRMPALDGWFDDGRRDGVVGLSLIAIGFLGQLAGALYS